MVPKLYKVEIIWCGKLFVSVNEAARLLSSSQPVAIPTETVWGLAALSSDEVGIQRIFSLKRRPPANPLIIHIGSIDDLLDLTHDVPQSAHDLISAFWPGGLTLVLPCKTETIPSVARAGLPTAAFRMPDHETTRQLLTMTGPLVAPSANLSGKPSATDPKHIVEDFGPSFPILYTDIQCRHGIESTILIWSESKWMLGRFGAISLTSIQNVLGYLPERRHSDRPLCPGQMFRHYAPEAKLILSSWNEACGTIHDGVLGFSDRQYPGASTVITTGPSTDPIQATEKLYESLRKLDYLRLQSVIVDLQVPATHEWLPYIDRLTKAATHQS